VHYVYHPCDDAVKSLHELAGKNLKQQTHQRLIKDEVVTGMDELGVLLAGHSRNAYWFGSQLAIEEARRVAPHNNATSLQVVYATSLSTPSHFCGPHAPSRAPAVRARSQPPDRVSSTVSSNPMEHIRDPCCMSLTGHTLCGLALNNSSQMVHTHTLASLQPRPIPCAVLTRIRCVRCPPLAGDVLHRGRHGVGR
jgi:hypothetical protein